MLHPFRQIDGRDLTQQKPLGEIPQAPRATTGRPREPLAETRGTGFRQSQMNPTSRTRPGRDQPRPAQGVGATHHSTRPAIAREQVETLRQLAAARLAALEQPEKDVTDRHAPTLPAVVTDAPAPTRRS